VKTIDWHGGGAKPFFDVVSLAVIELIAQFTTCEDSQIARSINKKLRIGDIVVLSEAMEERRREVSPGVLTRRFASRLHIRTWNILRTTEYIEFEQ
jgi:hypothetical protein